MLSNLEELHKESFEFSWRERNEKGHQSAKTAQNGERPDQLPELQMEILRQDSG